VGQWMADCLVVSGTIVFVDCIDRVLSRRCGAELYGKELGSSGGIRLDGFVNGRITRWLLLG
jgi:hypothetical protein